MKYFKNLTTLEELKKEYKKLAFANHPDRGGNTETMQEINSEYDKVFKLIQDGKIKEDKKVDFEETPEQFRDIISKIINLIDVDIEICGNWIWLSGNTRIYKEELKSYGFMWASKKCMWYWRSEEYAVKSRKNITMDKIREKYGSEKINSSFKFALA